MLGDIYHVRLQWHRNSTWRKTEDAPAPNFDPSRWGYPDWEHLLNWRMYRKYSEGLLCELGSHQLNATSWFLDAAPEAVYCTGGTYRFNDGREVFDHVYATFDFPDGRTATFSSIQSNAFEANYEMFMGTKGTLIMSREFDAFLFHEGENSNTRVEVSKQSGPVADASATQAADSTARTVDAPVGIQDKGISYKNEIAEFCAAVRTGSPVRCGGEKAYASAMAILTGNSSADKQTRLQIPSVLRS
jgi:predicted dehydrogenase